MVFVCYLVVCVLLLVVLLWFAVVIRLLNSCVTFGLICLYV